MNVAVHTNEDGDAVVGVEADGVFVPFTTIPAYRIGHYRERGEQLLERAAAGDAAAGEALALVPATTKKPRGKNAAEGDES